MAQNIAWNQNIMRSSKSRSRNKSNRSNNNNNRSSVNIVNRVFDSSGPESKVRGTPQQIIDKYNQLARDAQLSNDRVAAENFQQHAEHYLRLLSEAQREIDARREQEAAAQAQRDRQHQQNQQNQQNTQPDSQQQPQPQAEKPAQEQPSGDGAQPAQAEADQQPRPPRRARTPRAEKKSEPRDDVIETENSGDSGLVDTPESKPSKPRRTRAKPKPKADTPKESVQAADEPAPDAPKAAE